MKKIIIVSVTLLSFITCNSCKNVPGDVVINPTPINENFILTQETIFSDRGIIWGFEFLPNADIIFTEKSGKMGIYSNGKIT